jgi:hypothetical protein
MFQALRRRQRGRSELRADPRQDVEHGARRQPVVVERPPQERELVERKSFNALRRGIRATSHISQRAFHHLACGLRPSAAISN